MPPALTAPAQNTSFRWRDWQPRVGVAYSLGSEERTIVRASYARFANQLNGSEVSPFSLAPSPASGLNTGSGGVVYAWNDANRDNLVEPGELDTSRILRSFGFDPANPNSPNAINQADPGLGSVRTDEITLGLDHQVLPKLALTLLGTYRKMTNFEIATGFGLTQSDYILSTTNYRENGLVANPPCPQIGYACGVLPGGARYNVPVYRIKPGVPISPGQYTTNNPDYSQTYYGIELQATKRYADNWMARFGVSYNDWKQQYGAHGFVDPTNVEILDDGLAIAQSLGSGDKQKVYLNATWQGNLSLLYTLPRGFSLAGNIFAREGYPLAYFQNLTANPTTAVSYERTKVVIAAPYDRHRYGTVSTLDLGLAKSFKLNGFELELLADGFNVTNENTVLQRQNQIGVTGPNGTNSILEIQSPRIVRVGVRLRL